MSDFLAKTIKDQTDSILRRMRNSPGSGAFVRGGTATPGAGAGTPPEIADPSVNLDQHKAGGDHDGRYYTESEVDGMFNFVGLSDTPAAYTGEGGKIVAVKADVSGLEFVAAPAAANGVPAGGTTNQLAAKNSNADYDLKWMDAPAAANGLPEGGTAGQVLEKIDGTDYNTQWADAGGASPLTTKGDVYVYGSADARLPVGTDGHVLTADAAQALGVKWAAPVNLQWLKYYALESPISTSVNLTKGSVFVPAADYYIYGIGVVFSEAATQTVKARLYELNGVTQVGAALAESGDFVGIGGMKHYTYKLATPVLLSAGTRYVVAMSNTTSGATVMRAALDSNWDDDLTGFQGKKGAMQNAYINNANPGNGATWTVTTSGGEPYGVSVLKPV